MRLCERRGMAKANLYLGIDPGATGAIASIWDYVVTVIDCPPTISEMVQIIEAYKNGYEKITAVIEKVNPFYKSSAKSAFTFGGNFHAWQAILSSFHIPYDFVTPRKWQKEIYDSAKKLDNPKQQSFERASRMFPAIELKTKRGKILDGRCDALLIAEYCKRLNR